MNLVRLHIAIYYKDKYIIEDISNEGDNEHFVVDKREFLNIENSNLWVFGIINTHYKKFWLEITKISNDEIQAKFFFTHIKPYNIIVNDGWRGYTFLNNNSRDMFTMSIIMDTDFGTGYDWTSHIEHLWSQNKSSMRKICYIIPKNNFILYLREIAFHLNIKNFNENKKYEEFIDILNFIRDTHREALYDIEYLIEFTNK